MLLLQVLLESYVLVAMGIGSCTVCSGVVTFRWF